MQNKNCVKYELEKLRDEYARLKISFDNVQKMLAERPQSAEMRNLIAAAKEARDVLAICFRYLSERGRFEVIKACHWLKIEDGVGVRLQDAITAAEAGGE